MNQSPPRSLQLASPPVGGAPIGLLLSGGLDSGILLWELLAAGHEVQPFYVRCNLKWEDAELSAVRRLLASAAQPGLNPLIVFQLPLADLYGSHWSLGGEDVPGADTEDDAVYLPGRNALLLLKPALWCQMRGIPQLALAPLASNPFGDATPRFFSAMEQMLRDGCGAPLHIWRPFANLHKCDVMRLAPGCPLALTFSCIDPVSSRHCGRCNKCHERQIAFASAGLTDPTDYVSTGEAPKTK